MSAGVTSLAALTMLGSTANGQINNRFSDSRGLPENTALPNSASQYDASPYAPDMLRSNLGNAAEATFSDDSITYAGLPIPELKLPSYPVPASADSFNDEKPVVAVTESFETSDVTAPRADSVGSKVRGTRLPVPAGKPIGTSIVNHGVGSSLTEPLSIGACSVCGSTTGCGCNSGGLATGTDFGMGYGGGGFGDACGGCEPRYYFAAEALYFDRAGDDNFTLSNARPLEPFEHELGGRYTIGRQIDCLQGSEFVFVGPLDWLRSDINVGTGLNSNLVPLGGFLPSQIETFNDAQRHVQSYRSQLYSLEANQRTWAFEGMSMLIGLRALDYEEDYQFDSVSSVATGNGAGFYRRSTDNFLLGVHAGSDMLYPVSQRLSVGGKIRVGLFANFNESSTFLANRGTTLVNANDKDTDFTGLVEAGLVARYRLLPTVVLTGGYESWALINVATVPGQTAQVVSPAMGRQTQTGESIIFHGATAGLEFSY
jgi:hypothetical protein